MNPTQTAILQQILTAHLCAAKRNEPIEEWLDLDQLTDDIRLCLRASEIARCEAAAEKLTNFSAKES
jgi:hypothetical protein